MADPFVAEIRMFGFNFAPTGWASCDGQLLPLSQNTALFSLVGTYYGGNGTSNFALPNLMGSAAMGTGQGAGLTDRFLGESGGALSVTLLESEIPAHTHVPVAASTPATSNEPAGLVPAIPPAPAYAPAGATADFSPSSVGVTGGGQPHENRQPFLTLRFCIALQGIYPPRP
jgi:microcystin-dependent protein